MLVLSFRIHQFSHYDYDEFDSTCLEVLRFHDNYVRHRTCRGHSIRVLVGPLVLRKKKKETVGQNDSRQDGARRRDARAIACRFNRPRSEVTVREPAPDSPSPRGSGKKSIVPGVREYTHPRLRAAGPSGLRQPPRALSRRFFSDVRVHGSRLRRFPFASCSSRHGSAWTVRSLWSAASSRRFQTSRSDDVKPSP